MGERSSQRTKKEFMMASVGKIDFPLPPKKLKKRSLWSDIGDIRIKNSRTQQGLDMTREQVTEEECRQRCLRMRSLRYRARILAGHPPEQKVPLDGCRLGSRENCEPGANILNKPGMGTGQLTT